MLGCEGGCIYVNIKYCWKHCVPTSQSTLNPLYLENRIRILASISLHRKQKGLSLNFHYIFQDESVVKIFSLFTLRFWPLFPLASLQVALFQGQASWDHGPFPCTLPCFASNQWGETLTG